MLDEPLHAVIHTRRKVIEQRQHLGIRDAQCPGRQRLEEIDLAKLDASRLKVGKVEVFLLLRPMRTDENFDRTVKGDAGELAGSPAGALQLDREPRQLA